MDETFKRQEIPTFSERSLGNLIRFEDDLQTVAERLGHSSASTTQQYYRNKATVACPLTQSEHHIGCKSLVV